MRDTPCGSQIFPLIITQANCFLHSSSLQERGQGGEAFLLLCKKGRRKIIFYIFPFYLYSFLSPPSNNSPLHAYPQEYSCICPLLREKELGRVCWVTFYLLTNIDWTDAVHLKLSWSVSSIIISNSW